MTGHPLIESMQRRCLNVGYDPGELDGTLGPKTLKAFFAAVARRDLGPLGLQLGASAAASFRTYDLMTPKRICHFTAQAAHETGGFRHMVEMGSGDKNGDGLDDYLIYLDRRTDLGNTPELDGDGQKYRGRGIFQLTGKANYQKMGIRLGLDLVNKPELAALPDVAITVACLFWNGKNLSALADADDVLGITKKINGGTNGLADRKLMLARGKQLWGL